MSEEHESLSLTPLYLLLPLELGLILGTGAVGALLAIYVHWLLGGAAVLVVGVGLMITASRFSRPSFTFTGVMVLVFGGLLTAGLCKSAYVLLGEVARDIPVSEAAACPDAHSFYFTDGRVLDGKRTWITHVIRQRIEPRRKEITYYAAPVVGHDWTPDQEVVVWAVETRQAAFREWAKEHRAGVRETDEFGFFAEVIDKATTQHGLRTIENPVLIHWVKDPMKTGAGYALVSVFFTVLFCSVWLVARVVGGIRARRRGSTR